MPNSPYAAYRCISHPPRSQDKYLAVPRAFTVMLVYLISLKSACLRPFLVSSANKSVSVIYKYALYVTETDFFALDTKDGRRQALFGELRDAKIPVDPAWQKEYLISLKAASNNRLYLSLHSRASW